MLLFSGPGSVLEKDQAGLFSGPHGLNKKVEASEDSKPLPTEAVVGKKILP